MLNTVAISVTTIRDEQQQQALDKVNGLISNVVRMAENEAEIDKAKAMAESYLNCCLSDGSASADEKKIIDEKFAKVLIACTADDQKKVRRRLQKILEQF